MKVLPALESSGKPDFQARKYLKSQTSGGPSDGRDIRNMTSQEKISLQFLTVGETMGCLFRSSYWHPIFEVPINSELIAH